MPTLGYAIIGNYDTRDWGLQLLNYDAPPPEAKTYYVDIPGGNGALDFSEAFGAPLYNNRTLTLTLVYPTDTDLPPRRKVEQIAGLIHGRAFRIWLSDEPTHYYDAGRCAVSVAYSGQRPVITIEATCAPYRLKTVESYALLTADDATLTAVLTNEGMPAMPVFVLSSNATITFGSVSHTASAGTYQWPDIVLKQGDNTLTITADSGATVAISWQEGAL